MGTMKARGEVDGNYIVQENPFHCIPISSQEAPDLSPSTRVEHIHEETNNVQEPPSTKTLCTKCIESIHLDYFVWLVNRLIRKATNDHCFITTFTSMRSSVVDLNFHATTKLLTPILPYPATTYDAIPTSMINFQDALKQNGDSYGGLWADEGVYRIAKEIQLINPE